jgi:hypothetical protein
MLNLNLSKLLAAIHAAEDHMAVVFRAADATVIRKEVVAKIFEVATPTIVAGEALAGKTLGAAVASRLGDGAGALVEQAVEAIAPTVVEDLEKKAEGGAPAGNEGGAADEEHVQG